MENYGNSAVKVLGMFHVFLRWKTRFTNSYFTLLTDRSPNLLSGDACYTLGVLKPCYTGKVTLDLVRVPQILLTYKQHPSMHHKVTQKLVLHFFIRKWKELRENSLTIPPNIQSLGSNFKAVHWQDILETYANIFTGIGKFPGLPYKFQLKPNAKPAWHAPRKVPIHLQESFHEEIRNLEALGILRRPKMWLNGSTAL